MEPVTLTAAVLGTMYLDSRFAITKDMHRLWRFVKIFSKARQAEHEDKLHIYYRFRERAKEEPDRIFLIFEGKTYTFRQLEEASNRLAHWLLAQNIKRNDVVCMMHQNHPTFLISLLAISKIGAIASLINTSLADSSLLHCIKIAKTRLVLFDPVYAGQVATMAAGAKELGAALYGYGEGRTDDFPMLTPEVLSEYSSEDTDDAYLRGITPTDPALLIYTSGTTGMPKAAVAPHHRVSLSFWTSAIFAGIGKDDIVYTVLPLYHSSGLYVSLGSALVGGGTVVLARKFSVTNFWDDCYHNKVTVFHYIGELCRYLTNRERHPLENKHSIRLAHGNGMRPDVWRKVRERFNIPHILEFYGSTEGVGGFFNYNTGELGLGAIGQGGTLIQMIMRKKAKLIRIDPITEEPIRSKNGFCQVCDYGEPGELVTYIGLDADVPFTGYYGNEKASSKKVLHNVFKKGDMYFRSGDLITLDRDGHYFFGDRLGDTFRWHAENVATTEVSQAVSEYPGIAEANIFGVKVPNHEGRAGMAAIVLQPNTSLNYQDFYKHLSQRLPRYAIPLFLRFTPSLSKTQTFKQQKVELRDQGIDPDKVTEQIYWAQNKTYVPFGQQEYGLVSRGKVKL